MENCTGSCFSGSACTRTRANLRGTEGEHRVHPMQAHLHSCISRDGVLLILTPATAAFCFLLHMRIHGKGNKQVGGDTHTVSLQATENRSAHAAEPNIALRRCTPCYQKSVQSNGIKWNSPAGVAEGHLDATTEVELDLPKSGRPHVNVALSGHHILH